MARGEGAIAFGVQLLDVPIVDRARQVLTHNSQLTTLNRQPVESCESKIAQAKYTSLVAFWIYGTIALERSIFLLPLPIISSDARLPSWHTIFELLSIGLEGDQHPRRPRRSVGSGIVDGDLVAHVVKSSRVNRSTRCSSFVVGDPYASIHPAR